MAAPSSSTACARSQPSAGLDNQVVLCFSCRTADENLPEEICADCAAPPLVARLAVSKHDCRRRVAYHGARKRGAVEGYVGRFLTIGNILDGSRRSPRLLWWAMAPGNCTRKAPARRASSGTGITMSARTAPPVGGFRPPRRLDGKPRARGKFAGGGSAPRASGAASRVPGTRLVVKGDHNRQCCQEIEGQIGELAGRRKQLQQSIGQAAAPVG